MNILFLTMSSKTARDQHSIYADLMRKFQRSGHNVYVVYPNERRTDIRTGTVDKDGQTLLGVRTLNVTRTNIIEKGLGQVSMEYLFKSAIRKYWGDVRFDLVLYSTPPITFTKVIRFVKKHNPQARTYLLLKDIFPQNAVDMGIMSKSGLKGLLYNAFRRKEEQLYEVSDNIGCMSPANVRYILKHNRGIDPNKVEVAPNSYEVPAEDIVLSAERIADIRTKYGLPADKPVFIYGGNLGKPQGIPFLIQCLDANKDRPDCHFVVVGDGTEYDRLKSWLNRANPSSVSVFRRLPKEDYDILAASCDAGLIFLDYRFTIPNYPSRLLPYLMTRKPVIACTDPNSDTGAIAEENGYGFWAPSNDVHAFTAAVDRMLVADMPLMGERGYRFFLENYTVENTYSAIIKHFEDV